jgi:hypothetical protein
MFEIEEFLRKKTTARATHQQLTAHNFRNVVRQIAAHFVPQPLLDRRLYHFGQGFAPPHGQRPRRPDASMDKA